MAQHSWGERNLAEQATIFALAYRAGLANRAGGRFFVQPADVETDREIGTDLFLVRGRYFLRVDVTNSRAFTPAKVDRTVKKAKEGRRWVYILKVSWYDAAFITTDPCFTRAYDRFIHNRDGQLIATDQACPVHGSDCALARKLWDFGESINRTLAASKTEASNFVIPVSPPPF